MDIYPDHLPRSFWQLVQATDIARVTGVNIATARRYKREKDAPRTVRILLTLWLNGRILPATWTGARFDLHTEKLVVDEVEAYSLGEFRAQFWRTQALQLELQTLRARINRTSRVQPVAPASDQADSVRPRLRAAPAPAPGAGNPDGQSISQRPPAPQLRRNLRR